MKKLFLVVLFLPLLTQGCGTFNTDPNQYASTPESTLCINYYRDLMRHNIHAKPKRIMIEQRGIDCGPYKEQGIIAGEAALAYTQKLKDNLNHLGSSSGSSIRNRPVNCNTRKVGGYLRTFCY